MILRPHDNGGNLCTGTVIAPKLVLTARHCVSAVANKDLSPTCNADGSASFGGAIGADFDPSTLYVFAGSARPEHTTLGDNDFDASAWTTAVRGSAIIHDHAPNLCAHDLALVVLASPITAPIAALRLDREVQLGEVTTAVGWGQVADGTQPFIRQQRTDVPIKRVGPSDLIQTLTASDFQVPESICEGDSGGPIFDQATGAVIGVTSRGSNGDDPTEATQGANTCIKANNVITKLTPFRAVFDQGFAATGATPKLEAADDKTDCHCHTTRARAPSGDALVLALALLWVSRRRRFRRVRR
jgi:hypothetical protein